jgi:molybdopterin synthase catalytic subunit
MKVSVEIIDGPIAHSSLRQAVSGAGASLTFLGIVRPTEDQKPILGLHYQAYQPMAENILRQLCERATTDFSLTSVDLTHSVGFVPVGATSLRIDISSEHRKAALNAMTWLIDELKREVPIWKSPAFEKEQSAPGAVRRPGELSAAPPRENAVVVAVNISAGGIPKRSVPEARATLEGLEGDLHDHEKHRRADRAISVQDLELLDELRAEGYLVGPGLMGENLTVQDLHVQALSVGDRLQFDAGPVLELTAIRKPCFVLDQIDPKLKETVVGRCGFMAKVLETGVLRPGQRISVQRMHLGSKEPRS